jgi:dCMP deaminase
VGIGLGGWLHCETNKRFGLKPSSKDQFMPNWERRYIRLARFVSHWSKDSTKVGAVIAKERQGAIALGYNGFPAGVEDDVNILTREEQKELKRNMVVHAEENALLIAGHAAKGATLYVWGKPICARCAVSIIQVGIRKVVVLNPNDEEDQESVWCKLGKIAINLFEQSGVEIQYYRPENRTDNEIRIILSLSRKPSLPSTQISS